MSNCENMQTLIGPVEGDVWIKFCSDSLPTRRVVDSLRNLTITDNVCFDIHGRSSILTDDIALVFRNFRKNERERYFYHPFRDTILALARGRMDGRMGYIGINARRCTMTDLGKWKILMSKTSQHFPFAVRKAIRARAIG